MWEGVSATICRIKEHLGLVGNTLGNILLTA